MSTDLLSVLPFMRSHVLAMCCVILIAVVAARHWRLSNSFIYVSLQGVVLLILTGLMLANDIVPYRPATAMEPELELIFVGALKIVWWLASAWLVIGFLRAFVVLGRQPNEAKLVQDLLAALVYLAALFAIIADVFDLPVKGLTSAIGLFWMTPCKGQSSRQTGVQRTS